MTSLFCALLYDCIPFVRILPTFMQPPMNIASVDSLQYMFPSIYCSKMMTGLGLLESMLGTSSRKDIYYDDTSVSPGEHVGTISG